MDFAHYLDRSIGLVEGLVNSHMPDGTHVTLDTPADLDRLVTAHGLSLGRYTARDLRDVQSLRSRLRKVFEASDRENATRVLNGLIDEVGARPRLIEHDRSGWHLHYEPERATNGQRLTADAAIALAMVVAEEGFDRLQVCGWETCADVFVDRSKNHSRRYCSPEVCGNRASAAAWRARRASAGAQPGARERS